MSVFRLPLLEVYREPQRHLIDDDREVDKLEYEISGLTERIAQLRDEWMKLERSRGRARGNVRAAIDTSIQELWREMRRAANRRDYRIAKLTLLRAQQQGTAGNRSKNQLRHADALADEFGFEA